jgi:hypothetical protein
MRFRSEPQRGFEPTNLPITSRLRYLLRHWGTGRKVVCPRNLRALHTAPTEHKGD